MFLTVFPELRLSPNLSTTSFSGDMPGTMLPTLQIAIARPSYYNYFENSDCASVTWVSHLL